MPNMAQCADKFSVIRSMHSYSPTHGMGDHHLMSGNKWSSSAGAAWLWSDADLAAGASRKAVATLRSGRRFDEHQLRGGLAWAGISAGPMTRFW